MILTDCLLTTSTSRVSLKLMAMSKSFGTNDIAIGKFQPLPKAARLTVKLSSAPVKLGGVNNVSTYMVLGSVDCGGCESAGCFRFTR